jgi:hypothetical protein
MFCAPGLVFNGIEGVGSHFQVFRSRNRFRRYRGRRVPFSKFARLDSFSAVPRASGHAFMFSAVPIVSGPVFMFCALGLVFGGTEGVRYRFHVLRAQTRFRRYRGCRVPFSCFARSNTFSAVSRESGPVFKFCAPVLVFSSIEVVGSRFHILRSRNRFRRYRGRRVPFSCFAFPDSFFDGTEGFTSRLHVLRKRTRFRRYR